MNGSITKGRIGGSFYLRVELDRDANGKRRRMRETFHGTKAEAQRRLRELLREAEKGGLRETRITLSEIVKGKPKPHACSEPCASEDHRKQREGGWLASVEARVGARTFARYRQLASEYIVPALGSMRGEQLRPEHVEAALTSWRAAMSGRLGRQLSPRSIRHAFDTLRTSADGPCGCSFSLGIRAMP